MVCVVPTHSGSNIIISINLRLQLLDITMLTKFKALVKWSRSTDIRLSWPYVPSNTFRAWLYYTADIPKSQLYFEFPRWAAFVSLIYT